MFKFVTHSKRVTDIASAFGWRAGARYTNLRDVRSVDNLGFLDINWKRYDFQRHLNAAIKHRPFLTIARDIESIHDLPDILREAALLREHSRYVALVPKDPRLGNVMNELIPEYYLFGYSVPTKYGGTPIPPVKFRRPTHLLGGRPDTQRNLASRMPVVSFDCNRFSLDASFGDYFDGETFRPHPIGGYVNCIEDSVSNITKLWASYEAEPGARKWLKQATLKI